MDSNKIYDTESTATTLLNIIETAVVLIDLNWEILFVNKSASNYFGVSETKLINSGILDYFPDVNRGHFKILLNQVLLNNKEIHFQQKIFDEWKQIFICPVQEEPNSIKKLALVITDISSKVFAEEKLKRVLLELVNAQDNERHRISQDLHDDVGQKMTAIIFELRAIKELIINEQEASIREIDNIIHNMEITIKHIRQIFYQLQPPSLGKMELPKVLEAFCSTFEETNKLLVDFSCQENIPELPEKYEKAIYRFVQEGLTNIVKHARASMSWVNLDYTDGEINISIEDNGKGFELNNLIEGIGLHGIRNRFFLLGGSLEIESSPGKGTRIFSTIPFNPESER